MAPTSQAFVEDPDQMLLLAEVAETWKCRPSELLWGKMAHFQIDLACALRLWEWREEKMEEAKRNSEL
jgi:hypothetical protein